MTSHDAAAEFEQVEDANLAPINVSTRHLRVFVTVYRYRSVTDAADMLLLSQPTVSRALKAFESRLGVRLFDRTKTGVVPTDAAEALYPHAVAAVATIDEGLRAIAGTPDAKAISVGTIPELLMFIVPAVRRFAVIDRDLARLEARAADRLIDGLEKGTYDVVILPALGDQILPHAHHTRVSTVGIALHRPEGDVRSELVAIPTSGSWERNILRGLLGRDPSGPTFEVGGGDLARRLLAEGFSAYLPVGCARDLEGVAVIEPVYDVAVHAISNRPLEKDSMIGQFIERVRESATPVS